MSTVTSPRPLIVKVDATYQRTDRLSNHFIEAGFQVVKASSVKEGIKLARRCHPHLIIAVDNLKAGMDAEQWLEHQHSDVEASLAMTPLLILADTPRGEKLRIHELPDRVKVLAKPTSPDNIVQHVRRILTRWGF